MFVRAAVAVGAALCVLPGCGVNDPSAGLAPPERVFTVETATVETRDVTDVLKAVGTVYANKHATIRAQVEGVIAAVEFEEGQRVRAGDTLVQLDDRKAAASLALARAQLDSARATLEVAAKRLARNERLIADELVSRETFESLEAEHRAAEAGVREREAAVTLASRQLEDFHILAPFDGTAGTRVIDVGNYVGRGAELTAVMQTDPVEARFAVPAARALDIDVGRRVTISDPSAGTSIVGEVSFIDPKIDPQTRMLGLEAVIPNPEGRLRPGQFIEAALLLEERKDRVVVPEEAVIPYAGKTWVFVVEGERAHRREVALGARRPGVVEITAGLAAGQTIVTSGQHRLEDGSQVTARAPGADASPS